MSDQPQMRCPQCGELEDDFDGFGMLAHTKPAYENGCGYCSHPSRDGGVCGICGDVEKAGARKTMDDLACERGVMAATIIADHSTEVEARRGDNNRLLFDCLILGMYLTWDPDRHDWDGPIVDVLAMMANGLLHERDQLRVEVESLQHQLTLVADQERHAAGAEAAAEIDRLLTRADKLQTDVLDMQLLAAKAANERDRLEGELNDADTLNGEILQRAEAWKAAAEAGSKLRDMSEAKRDHRQGKGLPANQEYKDAAINAFDLFIEAEELDQAAPQKSAELNWKAAADAWFSVWKAHGEFAAEADAEGEDYNGEQVEALGEKLHEAVEHAHAIDKTRRCPVCKGHGGSLGCNYGFVPCPECGGNPWEECLAEAAYSDEAARQLEAEADMRANSDKFHAEIDANLNEAKLLLDKLDEAEAPQKSTEPERCSSCDGTGVYHGRCPCMPLADDMRALWDYCETDAWLSPKKAKRLYLCFRGLSGVE